MSQPFELPSPDEIVSTIHSRAYEACALNALDAPAKLVPLVCVLSSAVPSGTAMYQVPSGYRFRLQAIRPHLVLDPTTEELTDGGALVGGAAGLTVNRGTVLDLLVTKAMNCRVSLQLQPKQIPILPQGSFSLYSLMQLGGGYGARFLDMPGIIPGGTVIQLDAALQDTNALATGQSSYYGVELVGALVEGPAGTEVLRWPGR